jgi:hypothetical protein
MWRGFAMLCQSPIRMLPCAAIHIWHDVLALSTFMFESAAGLFCYIVHKHSSAWPLVQLTGCD